MQRKGEDNRARGHGLSNRRLRHPAETKKPPFEVAYDIAYCLFLFGFNMVPGAGLEPAQPYSRGILNPLCLPISPPGQGVKWRRVPESNRGGRICNPLHGHSANAPLSAVPSGDPDLQIWSGKRDSNSRPRPWQGRALPTELFPHFSNCIELADFIYLLADWLPFDAMHSTDLTQ